ncbi:MAG: hypothetical protein EOM15_12015 [Spirochaetia bacterium]|nr:hypothetical protein [Spirochaetia bacterium]
MKNLLAVAEGILDAKEFLAENTSSVDAVKAYAENGLDMEITCAEAELILNTLQAWERGTAQGELNGTDDYYRTVVEPLDFIE